MPLADEAALDEDERAELQPLRGVGDRHPYRPGFPPG